MSFQVDREVKAEVYYPSALPSLQFTINFSTNEFIVITHIQGTLHAEDGTFIAPVNLIELNAGKRAGIISRLATEGTYLDEDIRRKTKRSSAVLVAVLSYEAIKHIENIRRRNVKGDVILELKLNFIGVTSDMRIMSIFSINKEQAKELKLPIPKVYTSRKLKEAEYLVYTYDPEFHPGGNAFPILATRYDNPYVINVQKYRYDFPIRISASDWIHDYAPKLGLGKYMIIEIPEIEVAQLKPLIKAMEELRHAKEFLSKGNDFEAMNCIRNAIMNNLTIKKKVNDEEKRFLNEELKRSILDKAPTEYKKVCKRTLGSIEKILRTLLQECISSFIHLETGKRIRYPHITNVEYAYLTTLACIKQLLELSK